LTEGGDDLSLKHLITLGSGGLDEFTKSKRTPTTSRGKKEYSGETFPTPDRQGASMRKRVSLQTLKKEAARRSGKCRGRQKLG